MQNIFSESKGIYENKKYKPSIIGVIINPNIYTALYGEKYLYSINIFE